ncbi:glycoside hydrolase family 43 protein [Breznakiellaceae bacterium SP9]
MPGIANIQIRDPFVVLENDTYYLFGSTDKDIWKAPGLGFDVYVGAELDGDFEGSFPAFRPSENFWSATNFWAPEVHRYKGDWYMFATFKPKQGRRGTAILKSEGGVMGPYAPWSLSTSGLPGPVTPADWECLDGTFFEEDGQPWMVFCHEWQQVGDGQVCAMPLTEDLRQTAVLPGGEPRVLFRASEASWAFELPGRAPGSFVTDGPFLHRSEDGTLLLLWSSFGKAGNYCIGVARSESGKLAGPWLQSSEPLYSADGGHGMIFRSKEGNLYLAIHTPNETPLERPIFVELTEKGGMLTVQTGKLIS